MPRDNISWSPISNELSAIFNNYTVRQVAEMTGLSKTRVHEIRRGKCFVLDSTLISALSLLGYTVHLKKVKDLLVLTTFPFLVVYQ